VLSLADLERSYRETASVLDKMNCGLLCRDAEGTIVFVNQRLLTWTGYAREDLEGHPVSDLVPVEIRHLVNEEQDATAEGDLRGVLTILRRKDSTTFPVLVLPSPVLDPDGGPPAGLAFIVDLGTIQTAKNMGYTTGSGVRERLEHISMELHSISLAADLPSAAGVPFEHVELKALSPREREVLSYLVAGDRVPAIARHLHISPHTVRNHLKAIYRKLGVDTQSTLIERVRAIASA
jgi:PAS domain S-box-containing protein